jgi:hypothetical protein
MSNENDLNNGEVTKPQIQASASRATFPTEAFPCPSCGQMLAASCRVCVACRLPIDAAQIQVAPLSATPVRPQAARLTARVYFPWGLFFVLLLARLLVIATAARVWGVTKAELLVGALELLTSAWVFYDAPHRHIAKPLRWGLGSLLLWVVFFPWYLARRRAPELPCPLVETDASPLARILLFILFVFLLLGTILLTTQKFPK